MTSSLSGVARCWPRKPREALVGALALWGVPLLVIAVMVASQPLKRTVTPLYHRAAAHWWAGQNLYSGPSGMNYLPHFAVLFSPFHLLPLRLADVLWRLCSAALLAGGLWKLMRALFPAAPERPFFWATLVAMPLCLSALRNGQANALLGGLTLLAIVAVLNQRWWLATGLMALAIAVKPLGIVLPLLSLVFYRPLWWRLPFGVLALVLFPFLFGSPAYVVEQHREVLANLKACAAVSENRFADINGLLRTFGAEMGPEASKWVRVLSGGLFLCLWWAGAKRLREPAAGFWLYAVAAGYLMLFNPMSEQNSYVILAPALAAWAAFFCFSPHGNDRRAVCTAAMAWTMALLPNLLRPLFGNYFALFWHPLMTILFLIVLALFIWRPTVPVSEPILQHD